MTVIMTGNKRTIVEDIKTRLLTNIRPESIILFGSVASGTDSLDSDIDLLVVWDELKDLPNIKRRIRLRQIIGITASPLDILTCSSAELRVALSDAQSFTSHIIKEGEVIYGGSTVIPQTHDLIFLLGKCQSYENSLSKVLHSLTILNEYSVTARYPSDFEDKRTIEDAKEAYGFITGVNKELSGFL